MCSISRNLSANPPPLCGHITDALIPPSRDYLTHPLYLSTPTLPHTHAPDLYCYIVRTCEWFNNWGEGDIISRVWGMCHIHLLQLKKTSPHFFLAPPSRHIFHTGMAPLQTRQRMMFSPLPTIQVMLWATPLPPSVERLLRSPISIVGSTVRTQTASTDRRKTLMET